MTTMIQVQVHTERLGDGAVRRGGRRVNTAKHERRLYDSRALGQADRGGELDAVQDDINGG